MFTQIDKAIVALIMSLLAILNLGFGWDFGVDEQLVTAIVTAAIPLVVYLWPNKRQDGVRVDGRTVLIEQLPPTVRNQVEAVARTVTRRAGRSILDRILGR